MPDETRDSRRGALQRFAPLILAAVALLLFFALGGHRYISLDALRDNHDTLRAFAAANPVLAPLGLLVIYAALVAISFPGASLLTIFAGFMFGTWVGGSIVVVGATIGATIIFLIARTALGASLRQKAGPWMEKFRQGFQANEFNYLLVLRLIPAFPFWLVNIAPALVGMRTRNYALATFLGIIPGTFVYASVGAGAGAALAKGEDVPLEGLLLDPKILGPIVALVLLSLVPVGWKKLKGSPANV